MSKFYEVKWRQVPILYTAGTLGCFFMLIRIGLLVVKGNNIPNSLFLVWSLPFLRFCSCYIFMNYIEVLVNLSIPENQIPFSANHRMKWSECTLHMVKLKCFDHSRRKMLKDTIAILILRMDGSWTKLVDQRPVK